MATTVQDCAPHCKCMITGFLNALSFCHTLSHPPSLSLSVFRKHPRIVFCVTIKQTLQYFFGPIPLVPLGQSYLAAATRRRSSGGCLSVAAIHPFWPPGALQAVVSLMAANSYCANPFCKRIWGAEKNRWSLCSLENVCNSLLKKERKAFCLGILWKEAWQLEASYRSSIKGTIFILQLL